VPAATGPARGSAARGALPVAARGAPPVAALSAVITAVIAGAIATAAGCGEGIRDPEPERGLADLERRRASPPARGGEVTPPATSVQPDWMISPPAERGWLTIDHVYRPLVTGDELVLASSALGCTGLDLATGEVRWREPLGPLPGPATADHPAAAAGLRCPAARLRCASPHAPAAGEPPAAGESDERERRHDALRAQARAAGVPAIQVLDAIELPDRRALLAVRLDTSLTRDALALLAGDRLLWSWPLPPPPEPRAEPMAVASGADRAVVFFDGLHAAALPLR